MTTGLKDTGWTPARRAAQAERIRAQKPWLKSTGPRTAAGKKACRMNGLKHGHRSAKMGMLSRLLRAQQRFIARYRAGAYHPPKRRLILMGTGMAVVLRCGGLKPCPRVWQDRPALQVPDGPGNPQAQV